MMKIYVILVFVFLSLVGSRVYAQNKEPVPLELSGYHYIMPVPVFLSEDDKRWLKQKKIIKVAVYQPEQPPLAQTTLMGRYRGMNADYLALIQHSLNIRISVIEYPSQISAINALKAGDVDTVLSSLGTFSFSDNDIRVSQPLVYSWPTLVTALTNVMAPMKGELSTRIAIVNNYPDDNFIHQSFPNAEIITFSSYQDALNSVANGENTWFMGDSLTTSTWLSQEFSQVLSSVRYWSGPQKTSVFLFLSTAERLQSIINNTISMFDENIHEQIAQLMIDKGDLSFLIKPLDLSAREKQWIKNHKTLRVIINPWFAPYTMVDNNQEVRGIVGDILNLISLQTGIRFETVVVTSNEQMMSEMKKDNWHIVQAATYDLGREDYLSFTHPFITTQFVIVTKKDSVQKGVLQTGDNVALSADSSLLDRLKIQYPGVQWKMVSNSSVALNLVATGKVDAAISNQLTARYLSEHYYPDQLIWFSVPDEVPAIISFAVPRSEPELRQILDKALDAIPQKEIFQIVSKWIRLPDIKIDTWELYNKPFYLVIILATLLILSTLLWAVYLNREVRIRKRSQHLLEVERNKAQKANEEKRAFLSHMSHEIRTPVSAIMGFLELLQLSPEHFVPEDKVSIDQATQASRTLLKLIGEILDLEKIESGLLDITPQWIYPGDLIKEKVELFSALSAQKNIELCYDSQLNPKEAMLLDPKLLGQVITNIIGNAVKFTSQGYVIISAMKHNRMLLISVSDSGSGISVSDQSKLFRPFSQGKEGEQHNGSGLGLTISQALITQMAGTIELKSQINQGTSVTVKLPVQTSFDEIPITSGVGKVFPVIRKSFRVLIADDHPSSRLLLKRQLATLGIIADEAENGERALHFIRQGHYDLLITDFNMPVMDGIELTRKIRKFDPVITIWGVTATAQEYERERCLEAGMNECLFKPISVSQISHLLSGHYDNSEITFDIERLSLLAQGNRALMLTVLSDTQNENRRDLAAARQSVQSKDYQMVKQHIHRINGTAQILGVMKLMTVAQSLEDKLPDGISETDLVAELAHIESVFTELDQVIERFVP